MALYQLLPIGVLKTDTQQRIVPFSGELWKEYQDWLAAGNTADPYVPPSPPPETLQQAKLRRIASVKADGLSRVQSRFPAIGSLELLDALTQFGFLSVVLAGRSPTADVSWCINVYQAGKSAIQQIIAATTIAEVDAVVPAWPS